jgi:non-canonical poly(A) RNA polymerase PAPD5/7
MGVTMPNFAYEFQGDQGRDRDRGDYNRGAGGRPRNFDDDRRRRPRHDFTFRFRPPTAERPLLSRQRDRTPDFLANTVDGQDKPQLKFANPDELTDSDEAEMEESASSGGDNNDDDDEDSGNAATPPRKKRALESTVNSNTVERPKWSNPDPYTVLPPSDETQGKHVDVVKLIRKARLAANAPANADAVATNEDYISFDMGDDADVVDENVPPENAPIGPRALRDRPDDSIAGKKRTRDDEIKPFTGKFGKVGYSPYGDIVSVWKAGPSDNGTPWLELMEPTLHLGTRYEPRLLLYTIGEEI